MRLRNALLLTAGMVLAVGCNKDNKKTAPGSPAAKAAGQPVTPGTPAAGTPAPTPASPTPPTPPAVVPGTPPTPTPTGTKPAPLPPGHPPVGEAKPGVKKVEVTTPDAGKAKAEIEAELAKLTGPVAIVNGEPVDSAEYKDQLEKTLKRASRMPAERLNRIKENILKRLVEKELIRQAVKAASIVVPAEAIDGEFEEYKKRFRNPEQFQNYLKHGKVTVESIKDRIREKKELEMLLEKSGKLAVTDAEAEEFYKKNERFYQERAGVKARHILVKVAEKAPQADVDKAMAKIKEVQKALKDGMKFEDAAKKYSEGPSAPKGGDLGFFGHGQMVKPFETKAFAMKPGEVTPEPVRTRFGFHIIQVLEKREERKKPFDEVKKTIQDSLRNKKFFQERRSLLNKLRTDAKIEHKVTIPKAAPRPARPITPTAPRVAPGVRPVQPLAPHGAVPHHGPGDGHGHGAVAPTPATPTPAAPVIAPKAVVPAPAPKAVVPAPAPKAVVPAPAPKAAPAPAPAPAK